MGVDKEKAGTIMRVIVSGKDAGWVAPIRHFLISGRGQRTDAKMAG